MCLRLTVIHTLRTFVDVNDFDENQFLPFLQPLLSHIPALMNELTADDSFVRLCACIALIPCRQLIVLGTLLRVCVVHGSSGPRGLLENWNK